MKKDDPNASEESSITEEEEEVEDDMPDSKMTDMDENGVKKLKKLKPSGVVFFAHIDPDASSEEEVDVKKGKKWKEKNLFLILKKLKNVKKLMKRLPQERRNVIRN